MDAQLPHRILRERGLHRPKVLERCMKDKDMVCPWPGIKTESAIMYRDAREAALD